MPGIFLLLVVRAWPPPFGRSPGAPRVGRSACGWTERGSPRRGRVSRRPFLSTGGTSVRNVFCEPHHHVGGIRRRPDGERGEGRKKTLLGSRATSRLNSLISADTHESQPCRLQPCRLADSSCADISRTNLDAGSIRRRRFISTR